MGYRLELTADEHRALAWVADRYTSAEVLYDGMNATEENDQDWGGSFDVPEHAAWEYAEALPLDNGVEGAVLPPCVGGTLGDKLIAFWEGIV